MFKKKLKILIKLLLTVWILAVLIHDFEHEKQKQWILVSISFFWKHSTSVKTCFLKNRNQYCIEKFTVNICFSVFIIIIKEIVLIYC